MSEGVRERKRKRERRERWEGEGEEKHLRPDFLLRIGSVSVCIYTLPSRLLCDWPSC